MTDLPNSQKIAIYNPDLDNSSMIQTVVLEAGYPCSVLDYNPLVFTNFDREAYVKAFIRDNTPKLLFLHVWNETSWNTFINIRESEEAKSCRIVLTTTLGGNLEELKKNLLEPVKVISFPCEIDEIIECVRQELTPKKEIECRNRFKEGEPL